MTCETSPPCDLDELFSRDPLKLSQTDISALAAHYRSEARTWLADPTKKLKKAPKPMPKKLTLSDLGL